MALDVWAREVDTVERVNRLQSLDLDPRAEVAELYYRVHEPASGTSGRVTVEDGSLRVHAGTRCSFDTYFNAFFENYWFTYTVLQRVECRLELDGAARVTCWRQTPHGDDYLLAEHLVTGSSTVQFVISDDDELRVEPGRVWIEVEAEHEDVTVTGGGWFTDDEPVRPVHLAAVFCTFNRELYLGRILQTLSRDERALDSLARVYVVNQGDPFELADLVGDDGAVLEQTTLIEQPNLGGCGGFTRGMYETWNDDTLTHFVLLDDDSRIHADSMVRVRSFLSYAEDDVVVGGHMLNLHRPNHLAEAGAELDPATLHPVPRGGERMLGNQHGLAAFLRAGSVEYNGWWFFAAPAAVIDQVGLPLPSFIRGDDIEFGMRLRRAGWRTVPVPGIGVWHEPFYLKLGGWQLYFEVRNRLVSASLHDAGDWSAMRNDCIKVFTRDITMSRYHSAALMIAALEDYQAGPERCIDTTDAALQRARALVRELGPKPATVRSVAESRMEWIAQRGQVRQAIEKSRLEAQRQFGKIALAVRGLSRVVASPQIDDWVPAFRASDLVPHKIAGLDAYEVVEEHHHMAWRYERDVEIERELWQAFLPLVSAIAPRAEFVETRDNLDLWRDYWRTLFASSG